MIITGNAIELANQIEDEAIDFVITDPVYENTADYEWLAKTALRVLRPDSSLIAFCSDIKMFGCHLVMSRHLTFVKPLYYVVVAKQFSALRGYNIMTWTTPALWFTKGKHKPHTRTLDTIIAKGAAQGNHKWNKNTEAYRRWIKDFTHRGDLVFDPFSGSGTVPYVCEQLGRRYLAFEIEISTARQATSRLNSIQTMMELTA